MDNLTDKKDVSVEKIEKDIANGSRVSEAVMAETDRFKQETGGKIENGKKAVPKGTEKPEEKMICAVCSMPIFKGQAYKDLPADEKNPRRHYHESTCSPGSPNWMKFRGEKTKMKPSKKKAEKIAKAKTIKMAKAKTTKVAKAKVTKIVKAKATKGPKPKAQSSKDEFGYKIGSHKSLMAGLIKKGTTAMEIARAFKKAWPDGHNYNDLDAKKDISWWRTQLKNDGLKIQNKDGKLSFFRK